MPRELEFCAMLFLIIGLMFYFFVDVLQRNRNNLHLQLDQLESQNEPDAPIDRIESPIYPMYIDCSLPSSPRIAS
ncbi:hypothetical protein LOZ80_10200 [Paenibacillus sp. HWE-109]|uniref:hypothetical protein n=1 Tax=Paenibacillus sp. HWE-109 TaxID=1306526 RepID=UPI001EDECA18|nr:hypothetical protein [Paenibacillus sp. HWE-109]UKS29277.1 hypothetical protein LOZ80_10200 [Paenibacillus sp. HWE-109]